LEAISDFIKRIATLKFLVGAIDLIIVFAIVYTLLRMARRTRAWPIMIAIVIFVAGYFLSDIFQLTTLHWILKWMIPLAPVAVVILLFPELRNFLEEIGRLGFWGSRFALLGEAAISRLIGEVSSAAGNLSKKRTGALIVLERDVGLVEYIETGTRTDSVVSSQLLETVFCVATPVHDGAAIIRGLRILAVGCVLPLSGNMTVFSSAHTRHLAALGVSERSDAVVVVVSEETGMISLCVGGTIKRGLTPEGLRETLISLLAKPPKPPAKEPEEAKTGKATEASQAP
jgi:diadenylate cyclase